MKKIISTFLLLSFMVLTPLMTTGSFAASAVSASTESSSVRPCTGNRYSRFYKRHRNAMNVAYGSGGGAIIGALIGGGKGALIGAGAGAGGGALYTYVLNPKTKQCRKVYYRRG
ncbi:MAG: hypothetical protein DMF62_14335 [Acidobacteria bacterium]|nr:MAG: hypothetical protein DMF62_14335 [Acidobacteriota bacterium]